MFFQKISWRHQLITSACIASIVQALIYMHLLTITCLHNKAAVVTKMLANSLFRCTTLTATIAGIYIILLITQAAGL